jgi:two-component sensor histidine kinase
MLADANDRPAPDLDRPLILAPLRKDSDYLAELLSKHSIDSEICEDADCLKAALPEPPGLLIVTHEALSEPVLECVAEHLREQPDWSELPIVVLLDKATRAGRVHALLAERWPRSRLVFYHRPVATLELLSGIQSLLLARVRQRDVRDHLEREVELRRELNHRVKNILASVLSILHLTRRNTTSVDQMAEDFEGRLTALAAVHSEVIRAGGESVELAAIVESTLAPYRNGSSADRVSAKGSPLTITRDAGTTLALSLHELVTNALKYGALSVPDGKVSLRWAVDRGPIPEFRLEWTESGGPLLSAPTRVGYGTRYLKAAVTGLLGRQPAIEYRARGLRFLAAGPLARISGAPLE